MQTQTPRRHSSPETSETPYIPSGNSPSWIVFALVSSSYFVVLLSLAGYCLLVP